MHFSQQIKLFKEIQTETRRLRPSQRSDNKLPPFAASTYVKTEANSWKHLKGKRQHSKMGCEQQNHNKDLPVCSMFTPSRALCWGELPAKLELTRKRHRAITQYQLLRWKKSRHMVQYHPHICRALSISATPFSHFK